MYTYIMGVLFIIIGIIMIIDHFVVKSKWIKTTGTVKDYIVKTGPFYTPIVGIVYEGTEYTLPAGDSEKQDFEIGQTVPVYFDKKANRAVIDDGAKQLKNAFFIMLPGIAILLIKIIAS